MDILGFKRRALGFMLRDDSDSSYSNEGRNSTPPAYSGSEYSGLGSGYSSMGGTYGTEQGGRIPGSSGSWGYGANGRVYGDIQDAAKSLGVKPSSLTPKLPSWSKYVPGGSLANGLAGFVGMMQDAGLPGYAKTDAEWNAQTNPTGTHSGSGEYGHTGEYSPALLSSMGRTPQAASQEVDANGDGIIDSLAGAMTLSGSDSTFEDFWNQLEPVPATAPLSHKEAQFQLLDNNTDKLNLSPDEEYRMGWGPDAMSEDWINQKAKAIQKNINDSSSIAVLRKGMEQAATPSPVADAAQAAAKTGNSVDGVSQSGSHRFDGLDVPSGQQ